MHKSVQVFWVGCIDIFAALVYILTSYRKVLSSVKKQATPSMEVIQPQIVKPCCIFLDVVNHDSARKHESARTSFMNYSEGIERKV